VALPLQGPLQVQMSVTKARKRLTDCHTSSQKAYYTENTN